MQTRFCLFFAAIMASRAYGVDNPIVAVRMEIPHASMLSESEANIIKQFYSSQTTRRRNLRSLVINCCQVCLNWSSPECGIYLTNGYCSLNRISICRADAKMDAGFGVRRRAEEVVAEVSEVSAGLACESAKRAAAESLMNAIKKEEITDTLQTVLDSVVFTCYTVPTERQLISSFSLWDATTNSLVSDSLGDTVHLCLGYRFNVEAVVSNRADVKKVEFQLKGSSGLIYKRMEFQWRYMLYGDSNANAIVYGDALMEPGKYILRAIPNGNDKLAKTLYIQVDECIAN